MNLQAIVELVDKFSGPLGKINGLLAEFEKGLAEGVKQEQALAKSGEDAAKSQEKLSDKLGTVVKAVAGLAIAKRIFDGFSESITVAANLDDLAAKLDSTAGALKQYDFAAAQAGTSLNAISQGLNKLSISTARAGEGSLEQAAAFEALEISASNANGTLKSSDQLFGEVADKFKDLKDGPEKAAIAVALFGENAKELIPLLNRGSEGIEQLKNETVELGGLGEAEFTKYAAAADQLADNNAKVDLIFSNMFDTLASKVVPVMNVWVEEVIRSYKEGGVLRDVVEGISVVFEKAFIPIIKGAMLAVNGLISTIEIVGKGIGALGAIVSAVADGDLEGARKVWAMYKDDVGKVAEEHVEFQDKLLDTGKAAEKVAEVVEKKAAPSMKEFKKTTKEVKSELEAFVEQLKVTNQSFGLDESAKQLLEIQQKFNKDISSGIPRKRAEQLLELARAQIELNKTLRDGAEAQKALTTAQTATTELDNQVKLMELEVKLIGKSKAERDAAVQSFLDEAEVRKLTNELTGQSKILLEAEIKSIQERRKAAKAAADDESRVSSLLSGTYAEQSKAALDDVQLLYKAFQEGRIASEDQYVEAVKLRLSQLKDNTEQEVDEITEFWKEAARGIQQNFSSFFFDVMQGKMDNLGDRFKSMLDRMVADALAANLSELIFGKGFTKTGNVGGLAAQGISFFGNLFGGFREDGGTVTAGKAYVVGEKRPELFVPGVSGTIIPTTEMGGGNTVQVNITAMDSQDVRRALERDGRWLSDLVNKTSRAYNLGAA